MVGVEKPDPRIFELALVALEVEASRSVYIGDTVKFDVLGAEGAGIFPVHFDPYQLCHGAHCHALALVEVADWLVPGERACARKTRGHFSVTRRRLSDNRHNRMVFTRRRSSAPDRNVLHPEP